MYARSLFVFRQDLRIDDNTALWNAVEQSKEIIPIFIFDERVLSEFPKDDQRMLFVYDAVRFLQEEIKKIGGQLYVYLGIAEEIIPELVKQYHVDAVFYNRSYGPRSHTRDKHIELRCAKNDVMLHTYQDFLLVQPDLLEVKKVFTPYYKHWQKCLQEHVPIIGSTPKHIKVPSLKTLYTIPDTKKHPYRDATAGKKRLAQCNYVNYINTRNIPAQDGSSKLSPYIRFGLISIRQVFFAAGGISPSGEKNIFVSELAWREFWYSIMHYFPETLVQEFQEKRRHIQRSYDEKLFAAWKEGRTGYPIVDAGMRQLIKENRMHNRVRMIVASFLTKNLHIDRRRGEQHFKNYLLDYDTAVNVGNRQRASSIGADPKPLRIFSPLLQSKRFDVEGLYSKKYISELADIPAGMIHDPLQYDLGYAKPIVDHYVTSKQAKAMYMR